MGRPSTSPVPAPVFPAVLDLTADAVVIVGEGYAIEYFNHGAEIVFGYSAAEVVGMPFDILLPELTRAEHRRTLAEFRAAGEPRRWMGDEGRLQARRKDGSGFAAEASICRIDVDGATYFAAIIRDVSERADLLEQEERARVAAEAAERRARFRAAAGEALTQTLDHDLTVEALATLPIPELADWTLVYLAQRGSAPRRVEVRHRDPESQEILRSLLHDLPLPGQGDPIGHVMARRTTIRLKETRDMPWSDLARAGKEEELARLLADHHGVLVPLLLRGTPIGVLALFREKSEGRRFGADEMNLLTDLGRHAALAVDNARLHGEAREAARLRDEILSVVSHDLRNPISVISMTVSLMRDLEMSDEERDRRLGVIQRTTQSMNRLVEDLLEVSRIEAGRLSLDLASWDPAVLVDQAYQTFHELAAQRSIELSRRVARDLPPVVADVERVGQVFANLIGNALKFTPADGWIRVEADRAESGVVFRAVDTGPGIEEAHLPHVFDRFWQATHNRRGGAGLGLAIVRGIVEAHGGQVGVSSRPGEGSTFWFSLPIDRRAL